MNSMEIYRNTEPEIKVVVPSLSNATYSVTISSPDTKVEPTVIDLTPPGEDGRVTLTVPFQHTLFDGPVRLDFHIDRDGTEYSILQFVTVVTPMFSWHDLDGTYDRDSVPELERLVRHVIEAFTSQSFGRQIDRHVVTSNQPKIHFKVPLIEFTGISDRYLTHTTTLSPPKVPYEVAEDGHTIAIDWANFHQKTDSMWVLNDRSPRAYTLEGVFGYEHVPQDVKEAALLIAGVWGCKQAVWRDRFIQTMRSSDWSVSYSEEGFGATTGSHAADSLLRKYQRTYHPEVI